MKRNTCLAVALAIATLAGPSSAELRLPRISPDAMSSQTVGLTDLTVTYSRPGVKGRTIAIGGAGVFVAGALAILLLVRLAAPAPPDPRIARPAGLPSAPRRSICCTRPRSTCSPKWEPATFWA